MKPWFVRWRKYPSSIILHILGWGATGGAFLATDWWPVGVILLSGFVLYEVCSGVRHAVNGGHMDTAGLDIVDAVVGAVPAYAAVRILLEVV